MKSFFQTPFAAVFQYEVILNSKRIAPYALIVVFAGNAVLWWGWSAAASLGWATNGDFNIVRNLQGFSFILGLPIFNALIMGDPVIRDFDTRVDSLIFSKPIGRASYLFGKFSANFFVLVCCMAAFMLTSMALQFFPTTRLVVLPARVYPYFKHFFLIVVISHMFLAVIYFGLATLKRNAKLAYAAAVAFYPLYFGYQLLLKNLPPAWRVILDPMMLSSFQIPRDRWVEASWINQIVITYSSAMIANRALMVVIVAICLTILYFRFALSEPERTDENFQLLNLSNAPAEKAHADLETASSSEPFKRIGARRSISVPDVGLANKGVGANLRKLVAATAVELALLRHERSLMVLVPLSIFISFLALPWSTGASGAARSAVFAGNTASGLLLFLLGSIVFYIGETIHRDREARVEPVLWTTPTHNSVFLLSKFVAVLLISVLLMIFGGVTAMLTQLLRGQTPFDLSAYLMVYTVILIPSLVFVAAASLALNVLLRDKYLAYAISIAMGAALFYLYSQGFNHWFYNPLLYGLWTPQDLASGDRLLYLTWIRIYWFAIAVVCLMVAHVLFERRSN